jgi:DNA-binding SARP family transcriptional activator
MSVWLTIMQHPAPLYVLNLLGSFRLFTPERKRVEIASKKGIALIAMLAMADRGEHARGWLQDRLWGSRARPQAQSSLRRELSVLRHCLNDEPPPLLICERHWVRLDLQLLWVDAHAPDARRFPNAVAGEFLEGLDIPGEEGFEDWLREQRRVLELQIWPGRHPTALEQ